MILTEVLRVGALFVIPKPTVCLFRHCRLVGSLAEFAGYGQQVQAREARQKFGADLRQRVYQYWNITDRAGEVPSQTNQDLTFCLPTERDVNSIRNRLEKLIGETVERDLPKDLQTDLEACVATSNPTAGGCDPRWVGDGKCDVSCYNEACRWDGNDCGGPVLNSQGVPPVEVPIDSQLINTGSGREACMLKPSDQVTPPLVAGQTVATGWKFNYWEECNGLGTCSQLGPGQPFTCNCPNNCVFPSSGATSWYQCGFPPG